MPEAKNALPGEEPAKPSSKDLFVGFLRLGATAFGGPATIAQMRALVVGRKQWLQPSEFDESLALAQVLPGASALQCAAATGYRLRGIKGAAASFIGFGLPASLLMLLASVAYANALRVVPAQATLLGLRVAVIAIVAWSAFDFARSNVKSRTDGLLVALAAVLLILSVHPVWVVVVAAVLGMLGPRPAVGEECAVHVAVPGPALRAPALLVLAVAAILVALSACRPDLARLGLTMMRIDVLAFGGGFAAIPLMHDEFVKSRGLMSATTLLDGIAFGQVTPGPVIVTATFIGYQVLGLLGAIVATLGVFFPSFTLVITFAPWFKHLQRLPRFRAATRAAALAFVGLLIAVTFQLGHSMHWTVFSALLGIGALVCLRLGIQTLWLVIGCAGVTTLVGTFAVR